MATVDGSASKARGLLSQFENGHTLLALVAGRHVFGVTDALQSSRATVCGSMEAVQHSLAQLRSMRLEEFFNKVWSDTQSQTVDCPK